MDVVTHLNIDKVEPASSGNRGAWISTAVAGTVTWMALALFLVDSSLNNRKRITLVSFLANFVMSGMLAPIGIISTPMSEYFGQPVTEITAHFSWLTVGILIGSVIALLVF